MTTFTIPVKVAAPSEKHCGDCPYSDIAAHFGSIAFKSPTTSLTSAITSGSMPTQTKSNPFGLSLPTSNRKEC